MAPLLGYGIDAYGTSYYGSAGAPLAIDNAFAVATRAVRVTLSAEPKLESPYVSGDGLNPATWQFYRLDDAGAQTEQITVINVEIVEHPLVLDIYLMEPMGSHNAQHRIKSTTLRAANGQLIGTTHQYDFPGVLFADTATPQAQTATRQLALRDIANLPVVSPEFGNGGTLQITASGDYANEEGVALVKKLVLRRVLTRRGAFFHLPSYGVGLPVKLPVPSGELLRIKGEIERQVRLEPEVEAVSASLQANADGTMYVGLKVRLRPTGQQVEVSATILPGGTLS
jgi:phage baseplate assembly protein W